MATVSRPSVQATWVPVNVQRMIVLVDAPRADDGKAGTVHNWPTAGMGDKMMREAKNIDNPY